MIVLDTHTWVWWVSNPGKLSPAAASAIADADELGVCTISCWEVAILVAKGRLQLDRDVATWVSAALALSRVRALPLTWEIAIAAGQVRHGEHNDPADRIIHATALSLQAPLVTKDQRLHEMAQAAGPDGPHAIW